MILVDANVLLRLIQIGHPHQQPALDAIALLHSRDPRRVRCLSADPLRDVRRLHTPRGRSQSWFGADSGRLAMAQLEVAERQFDPQAEPPTVVSRWKELVVMHGVIGKSTHDARLVVADDRARDFQAAHL